LKKGKDIYKVKGFHHVNLLVQMLNPAATWISA
jgi:hypothetical protein